MDTLYYDDDANVGDQCEVKIDERSIVVSYHDEGGWVNYSGKNDGSGPFELSADGSDGRATLHMFPNSNVLEGYWVEENTSGMWRIELA